MRLGVARISGAAAVLAAAAVMGACGDDDDAGGGGGGASIDDADLTVIAEDTLTFDRDSYTAPAGEITIGYENGGNLTHTLLVDGVDADDFKLTVTSGGDTDAGAVELEPGEYRIYCDVPGHDSMEATLTVE